MKKTVLALAVATTLAAPVVTQADTILYGSARVSIDYIDEDPINGYWDVVDNDSRLGVLGSEELGGGLSAIYQYEFGVDVTDGGNFNGNRPKFVGLRGGFGSLTVGTQESPYYHVTGITDTFNSSKSFGSTAWLGGSLDGFTVNISSDRASGGGALTRLSNSIYYATPDFNGFTGEAMLVLNGANNEPGYSDGIDMWNIAAKYSNGPFFAGVSYISLDGEKVSADIANNAVASIDLDMDQWTVGLGYTAGPFSVGLIYEQGTLNEWGLLRDYTIDGRINGVRFNDVKFFPGADDAQNWYLTASYAFGNNTIRAAYGQLDTGISRDFVGNTYDDKMDNYLVGYQYNFSKRTSVWAEYIGRRADNILYGDQDAVSIGTRVDF